MPPGQGSQRRDCLRHHPSPAEQDPRLIVQPPHQRPHIKTPTRHPQSSAQPWSRGGSLGAHFTLWRRRERWKQDSSWLALLCLGEESSHGVAASSTLMALYCAQSSKEAEWVLLVTGKERNLRVPKPQLARGCRPSDSQEHRQFPLQEKTQGEASQRRHLAAGILG